MAVHQVQVFQLGIETQFNRLTDREKRYAHHMARAAWLGARVILRQVSPESSSIFDFIIELHRACSGNWHSLIGQDVSSEDLHHFLTYAAAFLSNIGNYYGSGDQKFIPAVKDDDLKKLADISPVLEDLYKEISKSIADRPPFNLGFSSETAQSSYYPGSTVTESDAIMVSKILEQNGMFPENTRLQKSEDGTGFEVLISSVEPGVLTQFSLPNREGHVTLLKGDHSSHLQRICDELNEASKHAANDLQKDVLSAYMESFQTGSLDIYRKSLRLWVQDKAPRVENIFGFVEPYRDPLGIRAEFEALVAIADDSETRLLAKLVDNSAKFIRRLPWATPENHGKGPFEKSLFEPPDFSSIHALAYCSSIIFPGINLPNYNDIRQEDGFKNVIIANRMAVESQAEQYPSLKIPRLNSLRSTSSRLTTGRMMVESVGGIFNFDSQNPPVNPITGKHISSWYKPGQTWTGQFGDLATTVDECRAELVGAYLMDDPELLEMLGFTETSEIRAADLTYNLYLQLGVDGLRGLSNYNMQSAKWGQAHSRAHFAMLKCLILDGGGVMTVTHNKPRHRLTVRVDRSKIQTHGKPALEKMLLHLHMFRCTADVEGCRTYYEMLSAVDGEYIEWRETVLANKPPPLVFVQANTFLDGDTVILKEYEPTVEGVITSWVERKV